MEQIKRLIDTEKYLSEISNIIQSGKCVSVPVTGSSMEPFLKNGRDMVLLGRQREALDDIHCRIGDIILFRRTGGQYVLHRICKISRQGCYVIGDAQTAAEGPLQNQQIVAKVMCIRRNGVWKDVGYWKWRLFGIFWVRVIPFRPRLRRVVQLCFGVNENCIKKFKRKGTRI
ncbi:MAG: S26 family signal peptidase [Catenibacillus sp.]